MAILADSPQKQSSKGASAKERSQQLRQTIDGSLDTLAKAVDEVRASETFKQYLDMQAKFHRYSWCNSLLILSQRPSASQVAGFKAWQKLGRHVRKGEHGIRIFAPCPWKRENVNENGETETVHGMYFKVVSVFDIEQTDGEPLPTVDVPTVKSAADELLAKLIRVAESRSIGVTFKPIDGGAFGVSKQGAIEVSDEHATGQQAKTLAHELAHESLHWDVKGPITRNIAELEAESVAYVVCTHLNLDVEVRASRYIALWGGDSKALRESLERIASTARAIIDEVEALDVRKAVA